MDFHTLSRKELQTLCKKNLIPANMTNVAMADALTALTNVEGIEDIARPTMTTVSENPQSLPESPGTCRGTSTRRRPIKNPIVSSIKNEPKSSLPLTRSRLRSTRISNQEEEQEKKDLKDLNENPYGSEIPKTPVRLNGPKRATGASDRKKIETHIKEDRRDEVEKENPSVARVYSTRRSARLMMSEKKMSESVPKKGGRRTEAIKIATLSEEESGALEKKSMSDVKDEIEEDEGVNVNADQEDLVSEDASATMVSAEVSGSITSLESSPSVNARNLESKEFVVEDSNGACSMVFEDASTTICVPGSSPSAKTRNLESKEFVVEDSNEDASIINVLESSPWPKTCNLESKEFVVEDSNGVCSMVSEDSSNTHVSPLKKTCNLDSEESVVDDSYENHDQDLVSAQDVGLNLTVVDEFSDEVSGEIQPKEVKDSSLHSDIWDFELMKGSIQEFLSNVETEKCNSDAALLDVKVITEIESGDKDSMEDRPEEQSYLDSCLPTDQSKNRMDSKIDDQVVDHDADMKADSPIIVTIESEESHNYLNPCLLEETEKFSPSTVVDSDDSRNEVSKTGEGLVWVGTEISNDVSIDKSVGTNATQTPISTLGSNLNLKDSIPSQVLPSCLSPNRVTASDSGHLLNPIKVTTPLRSSNKKKAATTPKMLIKVLDDKENNNSESTNLRNNLKPIVAEEKENNINNTDNNKGEDSTQKALKNMSLRQLRKIIKENLKIMGNTDNKNVVAKEQQKLENNSRSALQKLSDNCFVGDAEN